MKIVLTFLFSLNTSIAWGLTYKGMIGNIGIFKDEQCHSIFVEINYEIGDTGAFFIEHDHSIGATIGYLPKVRGADEILKIILFDKKCDVQQVGKK